MKNYPEGKELVLIATCIIFIIIAASAQTQPPTTVPPTTTTSTTVVNGSATTQRVTTVPTLTLAPTTTIVVDSGTPPATTQRLTTSPAPTTCHGSYSTETFPPVEWTYGETDITFRISLPSGFSANSWIGLGISDDQFMVNKLVKIN